jgi:hypothetical protein
LGDVDSSASLKQLLSSLEWKLEGMAETVLKELPPDSRKKFEQLITELVHQRDVVRNLIKDGVTSQKGLRWLYHLRYTCHPESPKHTEKFMISLSYATFFMDSNILELRAIGADSTNRQGLLDTDSSSTLSNERIAIRPFRNRKNRKCQSLRRPTWSICSRA